MNYAFHIYSPLDSTRDEFRLELPDALATFNQIKEETGSARLCLEVYENVDDADPVLEDCLMSVDAEVVQYVIMGKTDNERDPGTGERLYWSDLDGWVSLVTADRYQPPLGMAPIGGCWLREDAAIKQEEREAAKRAELEGLRGRSQEDE